MQKIVISSNSRAFDKMITEASKSRVSLPVLLTLAKQLQPINLTNEIEADRFQGFLECLAKHATMARFPGLMQSLEAAPAFHVNNIEFAALIVCKKILEKDEAFLQYILRDMPEKYRKQLSRNSLEVLLLDPQISDYDGALLRQYALHFYGVSGLKTTDTLDILQSGTATSDEKTTALSQLCYQAATQTSRLFKEPEELLAECRQSGPVGIPITTALQTYDVPEAEWLFFLTNPFLKQLARAGIPISAQTLTDCKTFQETATAKEQLPKSTSR